IIVCLFREPDAGNPPVRFDEREQETEPSQTGLRRRRESFVSATGRLKPLRLFSTLLPTVPACRPWWHRWNRDRSSTLDPARAPAPPLGSALLLPSGTDARSDVPQLLPPVAHVECGFPWPRWPR